VAGYTKMVYPETVTHPTINRAWRRVTTLIETNSLPLSQATTWCRLCCNKLSVCLLFYPSPLSRSRGYRGSSPTAVRPSDPALCRSCPL